MVTCIIPAYNEEKRILAPLQAALQSSQIRQIVVINDGSTDDTYSVINNYLDYNKYRCNKYKDKTVYRGHSNNKLIHFISHHQNQGKASAILSGVKLARHKYIFMLDADIIGVKPTYLDKFIKTAIKADAEMAIYYRRHTNILSLILDILLGSDLLYSGERLIKKYILKTILKKTQGYLLETHLNLYCIKNQNKICIVKGPYFKHVTKMEKHKNIIKGLTKDIKMALTILFKGGIINYFKQRIYFTKLKYTQNYDITKN